MFGAKEEFGWIQCIQTCEAYKYIQQTKWHSYSLCWWEIQKWFARGSDEKIPWSIQQKNKSSTIFCNEFNNTDFESTMTRKINILSVCTNHQKMPNVLIYFRQKSHLNWKFKNQEVRNFQCSNFYISKFGVYDILLGMLHFLVEKWVCTVHNGQPPL